MATTIVSPDVINGIVSFGHAAAVAFSHRGYKWDMADREQCETLHTVLQMCNGAAVRHRHFITATPDDPWENLGDWTPSALDVEKLCDEYERQAAELPTWGEMLGRAILEAVRGACHADVPDLDFTDDGLFVNFLANTPAGADAWRAMHATDGGFGKVAAIHAPAVIRQLRDAGYTVGRAGQAPPRCMTDDQLLAELGVNDDESREMEALLFRAGGIAVEEIPAMEIETLTGDRVWISVDALVAAAREAQQLGAEAQGSRKERNST